LIGKAQPAVASEALKLTLTIDAAAYQNDAGRALVVPLQSTYLHPTLLKKRRKLFTNGVLTQTTEKGNLSPKSGKATSNIGWGTSKTIFNGACIG